MLGEVRTVGRRPAYRVWQFFSALLALLRPLSPAEQAEVAGILPLAAWPLFESMGVGDQRHSLRVLRALQTGAAIPRPVAQAALLHDCAKSSSGVRLWHRVAMVLLRACAPGQVARMAALSAPPSGSWRYALWSHVHHPQRGARLAAGAGCDPLAVTLIACHQDHSPASAADPVAGGWLAALQAADNDS